MKQNIKLVIVPIYKNKIMFLSDNEFLYTFLSANSQPDSEINQLCQKKLDIVPEIIKVKKVFKFEENIIISYGVYLNNKQYTKLLDKPKFTWHNKNEDFINEIENKLYQKVTSDFIDEKSQDDLEKSQNILYTDGGSRGNPGNSAIGYAIFQDGKKVIEGNEYIGITNSAIAEYKALAKGLETAISLEIKNLECRVDNLMIIKHLNGGYSVKNREFFPIYEKILELEKQFDKIKFIHIKREFNEIADTLVNNALDEYLLKKN